jgi:hypothetical protein
MALFADGWGIILIACVQSKAVYEVWAMKRFMEIQHAVAKKTL